LKPPPVKRKPCAATGKAAYEIFLSVVTWAEIGHGIILTKEAFQKELHQWVGAVQAQFAGVTLPLDVPVLVRWKQLLGELQARNRTVACEDSLIAIALIFDGFLHPIDKFGKALA